MKKIYIPLDEEVELVFQDRGKRVHSKTRFTSVSFTREPDYDQTVTYYYGPLFEDYGPSYYALTLEASVRDVRVY